MRVLGLSVAYGLLGYVLGALAGYLLVRALFAGQETVDGEFVVIGTFIVGPVLALLLVVVLSGGLS